MWKPKVVLAICLVTSLTGVAAPATVTAAEQSMADQYEPEFPKPSNPFAVTGNTYESYPIAGVPDGTKFTILNVNFGDSFRRENGYTISIISGNNVWFGLDDDPIPGGSNSVKFLVEYPDDSSEVVDHMFVLHPAQKHYHDPQLAINTVVAGQMQTVKVGDLPPKAQLQILDAPPSWTVEVSGTSLRILAPAPGQKVIYGRVTYADSSSDAISFDVTAVDATEATPSSPTSSSLRAPVSTTSTPAVTTTVTKNLAPVTTTVTKNSVALTTTTVTAQAAPWTTTATETARVPMISTVTGKAPAPITTTVIETVSVPATVTVNSAPVFTTVTATPAAPEAPKTVTVTQDAHEPLTVTSTATVTEELKPLPPVTETVTASPAAVVTTTVTEIAPAPVTVTAAPEAPKTVTVTQAPKEKEGSSTGSIISLVIGLLGLLGGIGAAVVGNPQLRAALPF